MQYIVLFIGLIISGTIVSHVAQKWNSLALIILLACICFFIFFFNPSVTTMYNSLQDTVLSKELSAELSIPMKPLSTINWINIALSAEAGIIVGFLALITTPKMFGVTLKKTEERSKSNNDL